MKKLFTAVIALLLMSTVSFAQAVKTKGTAKTTAKETKMAADKGTTKMKKDGTPDMRMKENKEKASATATTAAGKLKKDGTPDMRYKENKVKK